MEIDRPIILIFCLLLATLCVGAPVDLKTPPLEWKPILDKMAQSGPLKSRFTESRFSRFQKLPKRFEGRVWWDPEIGLCLFYEKPSELIINVLKEGLRKGRPGKPMESLPTGGQGETMQLFLKLFNWDTEWLSANFQTEGEILEANLWQLHLRPLQENIANQLSGIVLEGDGGLLNSILLDLRGGRAVEIKLSEQARVPTLSERELHLAFPDNDG
jgi:hypothetical protein